MQRTDDEWPHGLQARPIEKGDAHAWAELLAAAERVDDADEHYDADDLIEELADPHLRPDTDTVGLWSGEQMIGYGGVISPPNQSEAGKVYGDGKVHPEWRRRGIGRAILDWLEPRAIDLHQDRNPSLPGELHIGSISTNVGLLAMLAAAGFEPCRYFSGMERQLDGEGVPAVDVPDGLRLIRYEAEFAETTRLAHNEAFLDHWGSTPRDPETWQTWVTGFRAFRPAMSHLLLDDDEVAAYVLAYEYEADTAATGVRDLYVGQVGTRHPYRGRGAAQALLARTLAAGAGDGFQTTSLHVDSDNPTGAMGLYLRLGFEVRRQSIAHRRPLPGTPVTS